MDGDETAADERADSGESDGQEIGKCQKILIYDTTVSQSIRFPLVVTESVSWKSNDLSNLTAVLYLSARLRHKIYFKENSLKELLLRKLDKSLVLAKSTFILGNLICSPCCFTVLSLSLSDKEIPKIAEKPEKRVSPFTKTFPSQSYLLYYATGHASIFNVRLALFHFEFRPCSFMNI